MKNKIIITLVISCLLTTLIPATLANHDVLGTQTPGVNIWEGAAESIGGANTNDALVTSTESIYYGETISIEVNHSLDWSTPPYFLYYPYYNGSIGNPYILQWIKYVPLSGPTPIIGGTDYIFENIKLDYSGMWIISNVAPDTLTYDLFNSTVLAWFWVNGSKSISIDLSIDVASFGSNSVVTVTTIKNGNYHSLIDIRNNLGNSVFSGGNIWSETGKYDITVSPQNFTYVGNYTVHSYIDIDSIVTYYQLSYYNNNYGQSINATNYNHSYCGPWDPPEYFAEPKTLVIQPSHTLLINCTPTTSYAGNKTSYTINITSPTTLDPTGLTVQLLTDNDTVIWQKVGQKDIQEDIILNPGTYHFYAYNLTYDSINQNQTITITPYSVNCTPTPLVWLVDTNQTIIFNITPQNNGTLKMYNITNNNIVNGTDHVLIDIVNGTGNITKVNATDLGTVIFEYKPQDGEYRTAIGNLKVTTATAISNPSTVYVDTPKMVTIAVIHPITGISIPNVDITLQSNILASIPEKQTTDSNGQVQVGVVTIGTGDILILINGQYDPNNKFIIKSSFKNDLDLLYPAIVNEGEIFIVTITSYNTLVNKNVIIRLLGQYYSTDIGTVNITAPNVNSDTSLTIEATSEGYNSYRNQIIIKNVPVLSIVLSKTQFTTDESITVTVIDETGRAIVGAKVTFNSNDYYTQSTGTISLPTPNTAGNYTIAASFDDYISANKNINVIERPTPQPTPGHLHLIFELIVFIGSIIIAMFLLRKRNSK